MSEEQYSDDEGSFLVGLARSSLSKYLKDGRRPHLPDSIPPRLMEKRGAFVTIRTHPEGELRGCIGRPYPTEPLARAVADSAIDAGVGDPRFEPMSADELSRVTFEVSVLTLPLKLSVKTPYEYREKVVIGRDGVIFSWRGGSGLLLPQVPVEEGWDVDTYLSYACMKAGATPDMWLEKGVEVLTFRAVVFEEEVPSGPVKRKRLEPFG